MTPQTSDIVLRPQRLLKVQTVLSSAWIDVYVAHRLLIACTPDARRLQRYISMISLPVEKMIKETIHAMTVLDMQSLRGTVKLPASFLMAASVAAHGV